MRAGKSLHTRDGKHTHVKDYESPGIRGGESTQGKEVSVRG